MTGLTATPQIEGTGKYKESQLTRAETLEQKTAAGASTRVEKQAVVDELLEAQCGQAGEVKTLAGCGGGSLRRVEVIL